MFPAAAGLDQVPHLGSGTSESGALGLSCNLRHPLCSVGSRFSCDLGLRLLLGTVI